MLGIDWKLTLLARLIVTIFGNVLVTGYAVRVRLNFLSIFFLETLSLHRAKLLLILLFTCLGVTEDVQERLLVESLFSVALAHDCCCFGGLHDKRAVRLAPAHQRALGGPALLARGCETAGTPIA